MKTRYKTRDVDLDDVMTWHGSNADEAVAFLGSAYFGTRTTAGGVQMLLMASGTPTTPHQVQPGWKLVRVEGVVLPLPPETFAALFEQVG